MPCLVQQEISGLRQSGWATLISLGSMRTSLAPNLHKQIRPIQELAGL